MPNRTIYIRNEDLPLWDKCTAKSELMSEALRGKYGTHVTGSAPVIVVNGQDKKAEFDLTNHELVKNPLKPLSPKRGVDAIGTITGNPGEAPEMTIPGKTVVQPKVAKTAADVKKAVVKDNFCAHGFAPGFCKHSKCKNSSR